MLLLLLPPSSLVVVVPLPSLPVDVETNHETSTLQTGANSIGVCVCVCT